MPLLQIKKTRIRSISVRDVEELTCQAIKNRLFFIEKCKKNQPLYDIYLSPSAMLRKTFTQNGYVSLANINAYKIMHKWCKLDEKEIGLYAKCDEVMIFCSICLWEYNHCLVLSLKLLVFPWNSSLCLREYFHCSICPWNCSDWTATLDTREVAAYIQNKQRYKGEYLYQHLR